jgi:NADH-quinone oxidoreductase subunit L
VVLGDSLPVMFIGWEGVGLASYLLIGFWYKEHANASAGKKAFITNRIGDFGFLIGMFLLFRTTGTLDIPAILGSGPRRQRAGGAAVAGQSVAFWAGVFLFVGAAGKSAQIPLYVWLPDAMAGPTPVSALIHAATMVTAGVYLVARMSAVYMLARRRWPSSPWSAR